MTTVIQGAAAITLWRSGLFDTLEIAHATGLSELVVVIILDAVRAAERCE